MTRECLFFHLQRLRRSREACHSNGGLLSSDLAFLTAGVIYPGQTLREKSVFCSICFAWRSLLHGSQQRCLQRNICLLLRCCGLLFLWYRFTAALGQRSGSQVKRLVFRTRSGDSLFLYTDRGPRAALSSWVCAKLLTGLDDERLYLNTFSVLFYFQV